MNVEHFCFVIVPCPYAGGGERHNSCHRLVTCCRIAASSVLLWCLNSSLEARVAGAAARSSTVAQHHPLAGDDGCWRLHEAGGDGERCTILGTLSCEAPGWPPPHLPPPPHQPPLTSPPQSTPHNQQLLVCCCVGEYLHSPAIHPPSPIF